MNLTSISDLRQNVANIIDQITTTQKSVTIMKRSKPKAVLVDYEYFIALEEAILDLTDSQEAQKAKVEPRLPLQQYLQKRQLKQ